MFSADLQEVKVLLLTLRVHENLPETHEHDQILPRICNPSVKDHSLFLLRIGEPNRLTVQHRR